MKEPRYGIGFLVLFGCTAAAVAAPGDPARVRSLRFGAPSHVVGACANLSPAGQWDDVTPDPSIKATPFGANIVLFDPTNSAVVYVGTDHAGIWKSRDCGATWVHIDTGTLGAQIDTGATNSLMIDPVNPNVMYTGSLYGPNDFFKSTDGGVNWTAILPPEIKQYAPYGGFIGTVVMDPNDSQHLLISWHEHCSAPYNSSCYAEMTGNTWVMHNGLPGWVGGEGSAIDFLDSGTHWMFSSSSNGVWISTNSGVDWSPVGGVQVSHGNGQLYRGKTNHGYYKGSANGMTYSPDGVNWSLLPNSGSLIQGAAGDGVHVWSSNAFPYGDGQHPGPYHPFYVSTEADPTTWTQFPSPSLTDGADHMTYDPDHHILYATCYWEGVYRVVIP